MPNAKTEHVFISYAREDIDIARRLYRDLAAIGAKPWMDIESLIGGQPWKVAVSDALRYASHFLALISRNSINKKGYVQRELREALTILDEHPPNTVFVIPVRLDASEPQHERLRELNWIDLFPSYDDGFRKIRASIGYVPSIDSRPYLQSTQTSPIAEVITTVNLVLREMRNIAAQRKIDLKFVQHCKEAWIAVPATELRDAIGELLENAIKYTSVPRPGSHNMSAWINIDVSVTEQQARVSIESFGTPVAPEEQNLVFDLGYRGMHALSTATGTGKGLFFVKTFAMRYGGEVSLWSNLELTDSESSPTLTLVSLVLPVISPEAA